MPAENTEPVATFMDRELYKQASKGDVNGFSQVLDNVSSKTNLPRREILRQAVSPRRNTCLHIAVSSGHSDLARFVARECPDLIAVKNYEGDTALHIAARKNDTTFVKNIVLASNIIDDFWDIETKAEQYSLVRIVNEEENTAVHEALINQYEEIAIVLIQADPQVAYHPNKEGKSPLYLAAEAGYMDAVNVIEKHAVEEGMKCRDLEGKSAVHGAIAGRSLEMLKKISSMEDVSHWTDEDGKTPIHSAASIGFLEGVCYLLQQPTSSDIYQRDSNGFCPIHIACMGGHVAIVNELLHFSSDSKELLSSHGRNILHVAAGYGRDNVVSFLLKEKEIEKLMNENDIEGNTPLHLAARYGHPKVVNTLSWDKRVSLNLRNSRGITPFDLASEHLFEFNYSFYKALTWFSLRSAGAVNGENAFDQATMSRTIERYKDWVNTLLLVAMLVATVTFAAGFTMPGGNKADSSSDNIFPNEGMAVMLLKKQFQAFVVCNNVAMYSSITVALILIWTQVGDFGLAFTALRLATPLLCLALAAMSLAFMTGVHLVVSDLHWLANIVYVMGGLSLVPIIGLLVSFLLLGSYRNRFVRYISYYPFCLMIFLAGTVEPLFPSR